ncbi:MULTISPECIES: DUF3102 domain-containing protein [unclassified Pseudomonas]|jgi:hypothetical protein|uniref:DUF3102 domain-containing protein n=1 Tax=unclassified Pseudomonas TaxID=196821 RepID=UPI00072C501A|nr:MULTISPECIES: DUF3102 domain-containing protein [unclassified Pseudomonas]KQN40101.1 hypothetical protein ASE98_14340 [Pseudomonas sp. Leaf48]
MNKQSTVTAIASGHSLNLVQEQVPHGQWNAWLAESVTAATRTAQADMKLTSSEPAATSASPDPVEA